MWISNRGCRNFNFKRRGSAGVASEKGTGKGHRYVFSQYKSDILLYPTQSGGASFDDFNMTILVMQTFRFAHSVSRNELMFT